MLVQPGSLWQMQNKILHTTGNMPSCTPICDSMWLSKFHVCANVCNNGQGKGAHKNYKRLKFGGSQTYDHTNNQDIVITYVSKIRHNLLD